MISLRQFCKQMKCRECYKHPAGAVPNQLYLCDGNTSLSLNGNEKLSDYVHEDDEVFKSQCKHFNIMQQVIAVEKL